MKLVGLRPLSETPRVRRLLWLRNEGYSGNMRTGCPRHARRPWWDTMSGKASLLMECWVLRLQRFSDCFSWTSKQLVFAPFFLDDKDGRVMEASRADFEVAARSAKSVFS